VIGDPDEARARQRFIVLNLLRFSAIALVLFGIWIAERSGFEPRELGYVLVALGLVEFFLVPNLLRRAWKNKER